MASGNNNERFDVHREQLAKTYAIALLHAAGDQGVAAGLVEELESLVIDVLDAHPQVEQTLGSHFLNHEQRESFLDAILGSRASELVLNFLKVLSLNDRIELIRPVARLVRESFDKSQNRATVYVRVAQEASAETLNQIRQTAASAFHIEPRLEVEVDPDILGGVILRLDDTVYDASIRAALEASRQQMLDGATEAIESAPGRFLSGVPTGDSPRG